MAKVLTVISNGYKTDGYETGWWGEELFVPKEILENAGHEVVLASPEGGKAEIDKLSLSDEADPNGEFKALYLKGIANDTKKLKEVFPKEYDAILIVGGHGAMFDLTKNEELEKTINTIYETGGIVAAECHGPAALIWTKDQNGKSIIAGKQVTGYPEKMEPEEIKEYLPFSLEEELSKIADYDSDLDKEALGYWADNQIITSRGPESSRLMGEELVRALSELPLDRPR
ncbi:type 1 glutamine amidotransferase domain-containing protein [Pseudalkalibacillus caeni]|uniref:Type 1 glutamine amidotransferase domain-containing protein n=1 Tax=Exobacillus caeni TaxID=2574798 RepID=A0A5R9EV58_9BACL|nr:type 1 glutamine amidotransferase domain-containing protein [Pseudalkalibacillus caeni]TLS34947.1 type 1 glutamine amidotransferase domain-containing protein [Pseudalkalibacillus caeni]